MAKAVLPRAHVMVLCDEIEPSAEEADVFDLRGCGRTSSHRRSRTRTRNCACICR